MKKKIAISLSLIFLVASIALFFKLKNGVSIRISEAEIQSIVYSKFPIDKTHFLVLKIEYKDPLVELINNTEQVRMGITLSPYLEIKGKRYSGTAIVNGRFRYEPVTGKIFLTGFSVESLQLDDIFSIKLDKLSMSISEMLEDVYSQYPIYTLKDDIKQGSAKMLIRKVEIKNKIVTIHLGF